MIKDAVKSGNTRALKCWTCLQRSGETCTVDGLACVPRVECPIDRFPAEPPTRLAVITCHFNPCGYRRPIANYWRFRENLPSDLPLYTVELSFTGDFEIDDSIKIHGGPENVLWQKERLLNVALSHVPREYDAIAWVDADLLFDSPHWPTHTLEMLGQVYVGQLFERAIDLDEHGNAEKLSKSSAARRREHTSGYTKPGYAWAARRSLLDRGGFFDSNIIGGGDVQMLAAWRGDSAGWMTRDWTTGRLADYHDWASRQQVTRGRVGYIPGTITHLWHGSRDNRQYIERESILVENQFDPLVDLAIDVNGLWRWASDKPDLHQRVADYFQSRRED